MRISFNIITSILFLSHVSASSTKLAQLNKPHRLSILSLVSFTGNEPRKGVMCTAAQQMVIDHVNQREDILPGYHIEADFRDEGPGSMFSARQALQFVRKFEDSPDIGFDQLYQSPLANGPTFSPGCTSWGPFLQHTNMVMIASVCASPVFTARRNRYPNMYRTRISVELNSYAIITWFKQMGWKKFAILANSANMFNILAGNHLHQAAIAAGLEIVKYEASVGIDESTLSMAKQSGARIFVYNTVDFPTFFDFLCLSYKVGMTGPRYVFLVQFALIIDPDSLPLAVGKVGCPRAQAQEQLKSIFVVGSTSMALENNGNTSILGYDLPEFERRFLDYINHNRSFDYEERHQCYDRILQTISILDAAEKILKLRNMTLRNYKTDPGTVMKIVNDSAANVDFVGLRAGRLRYSSRLEADDEPMFICSWQPSSNLKLHYKIYRKANGSYENASAYYMQQANPVDWRKPSNKRPNDFATLITVIDNIPVEGFEAILSLATILGSIQLLVATAAVWKLKTSLRESQMSLMYKVSILFGCLILDLTSVLYSTDLRYQQSPEMMCIARPVMLDLSFSILNVVLTCKLFIMRNAVRKILGESANVSFNAKNIKNITQYPSPLAPQHRDSQQHEHSIEEVITWKQELHTVAVMAQFVILKLISLLILFTRQPPTVRNIMLTLEPVYDERQDTLTEYRTQACYSPFETIGYCVIGFTHFCLLFAACYLAYKLRNNTLKDAKPYRIGAMNATSLLAASLCIIIIIPATKTQHLFISIAALVMSTSIFAVIFVPTVGAIMHEAHPPQLEMRTRSAVLAN